MTQDLAVCVGLWLAEGNNKCNNEITFTNNSFELIEYFNRVLSNLFENHQPRIRVYVYDNATSKADVPLDNVSIRHYKDFRANKPYFIWRLASVSLMQKWKKIVNEITSEEHNYASILKGIFAGEGNIKSAGYHNSRTIRIAQKGEHELITKILNYFGISFKFIERERAYNLTGRWNWDKFAKMGIADLHPDKRKCFWAAYNSFKEEHYPALYLKSNIQTQLHMPQQVRGLARMLKRSAARVCEELIKLKKEGKAFDYKVGSQTYWIGNSGVVIVSKLKCRYMSVMKTKSLLTSEFAREFNVCWKSANRRLMELKKLGLADKYKNRRWYLKKSKTVIII